MKRYDHLFYFPVYWEATADEARKAGGTYQKIIDDRISSMIFKRAYDVTTVPNVSIVERAHFIQATLSPVMV